MPDNLMHYTNGTTLRKYQWDNVHDPESMVGWFQEDEESAMATKVLFVDAQKYDVKLDHPALFTNDQLTFISPSGRPIALPKTIKPSFTGTVKDKDGSIYDLDLTRGVLLAFEDNGKYYTASYSIVENDYYFKGYKLINSDPVEYKVTEAPTGSRHMVVIGPEDEYCFLDIISGYYDYTFSNVSGDYQAEGPILTSSISLSEIEIQGHVRIDNGCTQDVKLATIEVSNMDILLNGMIILNPKDNDGVMFKYTYNEKTGYIYRRITDDGDFDYLFWNGVIWKKFTPSEINQLVPEQEILTLLDIWEAIKNDPIHSSLDLAGFIPVIGMAADGLNTVIYLVEGDKTAAFLSSVAIISSGIVVGAKYGVKFVKGTKQVESVFKISDDFASGMENVIRNARNSITSEEILIPLQSNLLELAQKHGENGMQRLLSLSNDIDEVKFLYLAEELNKLENASAFFADLEKAEFETFIKNTGIGGVDSWRAFKNKGLDDLARNTDDLEIVSDYMKRSGKSVYDVASEIPSSVGDAKRWLGDRKIEPFLDGSPKIDELTELPEGYSFVVQSDGSKYIRRVDVNDPYTPRLTVDETGQIVKYTKPQRLASNGLLRSRLEQALGSIPDNHQAHHIVPSNVAQNSQLHQEAIRRGLYDVDRVSNGKVLAESAEDFAPISEGLPTHFGSHPNYDAAINEQIQNVLQSNNVNLNQLDQLTDTQINNMIDDIEDLSLGVLEDWQPPKLN